MGGGGGGGELSGGGGDRAGGGGEEAWGGGGGERRGGGGGGGWQPLCSTPESTLGVTVWTVCTVLGPKSRHVYRMKFPIAG